MADSPTSLVHFLYEMSSLRHVRRAHAHILFSADSSDTIASHSHLVAVIGWILAEMTGADPLKVCTLGVFHDMGEARSGDQNYLYKKYVVVHDEEIHKDQLSLLSKNSKLKELSQEYAERQTLEARVAKDADILAQVILLKEYEQQGHLEAKRWLDMGYIPTMLHTEEGRQLHDEILQQSPSDWWQGLWTSRNRKEGEMS